MDEVFEEMCTLHAVIMLCFWRWVTCLMIQPQAPECSKPFQLSLLKTPIPMSSPTHAHTHTHTRTRPHACARAHTLLVKADGAFQGGVSLQTVSPTRRNVWRCASFLITSESVLLSDVPLSLREA